MKKFLYNAWFWIKNFSSRQVLNQNFFVLSGFEPYFYNASDFEQFT